MKRRAPPRTVSALVRERQQEAMHLAERLAPPADAPCTVVALTRDERLFLVELLHRAVNESGPRHRARRGGGIDSRDRNLWLTVDYLRSNDIYKIIGTRWGVEIGHVGKIINEHRDQAKTLIAENSAETIDTLLRMRLLLIKPHK